MMWYDYQGLMDRNTTKSGWTNQDRSSGSWMTSEDMTRMWVDLQGYKKDHLQDKSGENIKSYQTGTQ